MFWVKYATKIWRKYLQFVPEQCKDGVNDETFS
jgi:hypothetical protein